MRPIKCFDKSLISKNQCLADIDKNAWQPDALYILFFSVTGCRFSLTAQFTEEVQMRESRKQIKDNTVSSFAMLGKFQAMVKKRISEAVDVKKEIRKVNYEIKQLKRKRRIREKANIDADFVT